MGRSAREILDYGLDDLLIVADSRSARRAEQGREALAAALDPDEEVHLIGVDQGSQRYVAAVTDRRVIVLQRKAAIASLDADDIAETSLRDRGGGSTECAAVIEPARGVLGRFGGLSEIVLWFADYEAANRFACFIDESLLDVTNLPPGEESPQVVTAAWTEPVPAATEGAASREAREVAGWTIAEIDEILQRKSTCRRLFLPALGFLPEVQGFAVAGGDVLSTFVALLGDVGNGRWALQMCSLFATDVTDVAGLRVWMNEKNKLPVPGRFCCTVSRDGTLAAACYMSAVPGVLPTNIYRDRPALGAVLDYILGLALQTVNLAAESVPEVTSRFGGRPPEDTSNDLSTLLTATLS